MTTGVGVDCFVRRSVHGRHTGAVVLLREAFEENLDRHRPHAWLEVVQTELVNAQPVSDIFGVGEASGQTHESDVVASLFGDVAHPADYHLDDRSSLLAKQVYLIYYDKCYC